MFGIYYMYGGISIWASEGVSPAHGAGSAHGYYLGFACPHTSIEELGAMSVPRTPRRARSVRY